MDDENYKRFREQLEADKSLSEIDKLVRLYRHRNATRPGTAAGVWKDKPVSVRRRGVPTSGLIDLGRVPETRKKLSNPTRNPMRVVKKRKAGG